MVFTVFEDRPSCNVRVMQYRGYAIEQGFSTFLYPSITYTSKKKKKITYNLKTQQYIYFFFWLIKSVYVVYLCIIYLLISSSIHVCEAFY